MPAMLRSARRCAGPQRSVWRTVSPTRSRTRMLRQRTLKNTIRATGVGLHSGKKVLMVLRPAPVDTGVVFRRTDLDEPVDMPRVRRERRRHDARHDADQRQRARLDDRAPAVGVRRARASTTPTSTCRPKKCRSWTAAPARSCSCCSRPASKSSRRRSASCACSKSIQVRGRRQVGALRSVQRFQGEFRDRVQSPDLQEARADARRWISRRPRS